ncbi:DUF6993 domain-containing protein [Rathayibacter agropyri]|uniref:DUF6993 domain-containing protein n=1 Tax=Rathayibacter agropyri TaxID=1634927 RepID=UPI001565C180|nr:hypothetical protein [Rathayibacter agropyri]NRD07750.1 hypothetical protein [Rathayibacter agropyri]
MTTRNPQSRLLHALVACALAAVLSGCTEPAPRAPVATHTGSEGASPTPAVYVPGGTAEQNLPVFDQVLRAVAEPDPQVPGATVVQALTSAGFSREAMQVTADETSVGLDADSVQVSVRLGDSCLLGQYGPKSGGVHAVVAAPIATGACLVGRTVPLDG